MTGGFGQLRVADDVGQREAAVGGGREQREDVDDPIDARAAPRHQAFTVTARATAPPMASARI
jgi:hypothetical protein